MAAARTKPSTPRLSDVAKHVIVPGGVVSTGWPAVRDKCRELGIDFRAWQHGAGQVILAKREDGKYAATIGGTGLSIPRQVGKTFLVGAMVFALCLLRPGLTVIWTAHRLRTAEETFGKMQAMARRRRIAPNVEKVVLGSGEEEIRFRNGSRILFGARERGFGRGFDEVDVIVFDESQILTEAALDDMIPATNQSRQDSGALLLFMGTPPKPTDPGEVFRRMRTEALSGEDADTGWLEFGADEGFEPTPLPTPLTTADWEQVAKANPSFPGDTPREAILRMRKKLGPDSFLREGLGIWDDSGSETVLPLPLWRSLNDASSAPLDPVVFAVDVSPDRDWASIGVAGSRADGLQHLELVEHRPGVGWVVERLAELTQKWTPQPVVVDKGSAAASLLPDLAVSGVEVLTVGVSDLTAACGALYDGLFAGSYRHRSGPLDPDVEAAVLSAKKRNLRDAWAWARRGSDDITPLVALTLAKLGHDRVLAENRDPALNVW